MIKIERKCMATGWYALVCQAGRKINPNFCAAEYSRDGRHGDNLQNLRRTYQATEKEIEQNDDLPRCDLSE